MEPDGTPTHGGGERAPSPIGGTPSFVGGAGAIAAAIGLLALVGWYAGLPRLTDFGAGRVPMAPSTALLLVLLGGVVAGWEATGRTAFGAAIRASVAGAVLLAAAAAVASRATGVTSRVEHLGLEITETVAGTPVGDMSAVTAAGFLLAGASTLLLMRDGGPRRPLGALLLSGAAFASALVFLLAYFIGTPLLQGSGYIPPALNTTIAFLALTFALGALAGHRARLPSFVPRESPSAWFIALFAALGVGLLATARISYRSYAEHHRREVETQLGSYAELKVDDLARWREERLGDGALLFGNEYFAALVERRLAHPSDPGARTLLWRWLERIREASHYRRVYLADPQGVVVESFPDAPQESSSILMEAVTKALAERAVTLFDLNRDPEGGDVNMSVLVPILRPVHGSPLGVVLMRIDAEAFLFPFLERWPVPSRSAETLLVRGEGDQVVFLNTLRFDPTLPLSRRAPLSSRRLPAAMAARGLEGVVDGIDYRGEPVVAALRAVPGAPWRLVARMDLAEIQDPLRTRLWMQVVLTISVLLAGSAAFVLLWRRHVLRLYRERLVAAEALRSTEQELRARNDELTRFTYTVSHDLKSPLVTIQTFVGYLAKDLASGDSTAVERDLAFVRNAAQKMSGLLDDLLHLSRIGRKSNPPEEVTLAAVVDEALALVAGRAAERSARVVVTDDPIVLRGDRARLVEVFQNLLDNAIKFGPDGVPPQVEVGVEPADGELVLFVRDEGSGIDPRHLPRLFGLFEKLDPHSEGTGIGLALVRRIVEVHGGRIWAESDGPGKGSRFRFTLAGTRRAIEGGSR